MIVCNSYAVLYSSPSFTSEQIDEMLYGEEAEILEEQGGFYKVKTEYGYTGWTVKANLFENFGKTNYRVVSPFADLLPEGRNYFAPYMSLPFGSKLQADFSDKSERYAFVTHPNEYTFYIHKNNIAPISDMPCDKAEFRKSVAETAKKYLGVQYRWGGRTFKGVDCSGLCFNAYKFNGIRIWRDADIDKSPNLRRIPLEEAEMGDLLFFENHMAMYLGEGKIIHSSAANGFVKIENLKENYRLNEIFICAGTPF